MLALDSVKQITHRRPEAGHPGSPAAPPELFSSAEKLQLLALIRMVKEGPYNESRHGILSGPSSPGPSKDHQKILAWRQLGPMSKQHAQFEFCRLVQAVAERTLAQGSSSPSATQAARLLLVASRGRGRGALSPGGSSSPRAEADPGRGPAGARSPDRIPRPSGLRHVQLTAYANHQHPAGSMPDGRSPSTTAETMSATEGFPSPQKKPLAPPSAGERPHSAFARGDATPDAQTVGSEPDPMARDRQPGAPPAAGSASAGALPAGRDCAQSKAPPLAGAPARPAAQPAGPPAHRPPRSALRVALSTATSAGVLALACVMLIRHMLGRPDLISAAILTAVRRIARLLQGGRVQ
ncbi:hypothetical protein H696_04510 [Fonticula alba]|uniref:ACB domain-containing protein n=1 Tax=Fonticula alba TaxID=691883 RepID=A0A058Z4B3_FONAL|nr:hypothetical protein H696_04510 [Fonticula alba]KCV69095.1 hypothetical protein H696_04510 [Fonticula alba]|eukprot:XP_009496666.1 hypothetical protein H696_04510 [Fonticula alba]